LGITYRVGGRLETLRAFLAEGFPVIVEKGYTIESGGGGWAGHYVLLTGYDEATQTFIVQDTNEGPDQRIGYEQLDRGWKAFNRVYILIYPPEAVEQVRRLLGPDQDPDLNRQRALEAAQREITSQPGDAYAWFNLGTNLVYFERYKEAAAAYDRALQLGLPWRFMRYQFGPYIAYFHTERFQDVIELAEATLRRTPEAEESLLWRGWARFRLGDLRAAREDFLAALEINPLYADARYALDYISAAP
jgi:tetratricopeptide (TPR) repeat protein